MSSENTVIYYPYDELTTTLIPVSEGCPHNKCTFCSMYKDSPYRKIPSGEYRQVLFNADPYTERVFLTGADPLFTGYENMLKVLKMIQKYLPYCACVASYASVRAVAKYTPEQLEVLHSLGLRLLYIGFESGSDEVLQKIKKGHTSRQAVLQAQKLNRAKITFHAIIMYGIAGQNDGINNAIQTSEMLNQFKSKKIITMNYTVFEFSEMAESIRNGTFVQASPEEKKMELQTLLERLVPDCADEIDTTHPTNLIKMRGKLPEDLNEMIERCC